MSIWSSAQRWPCTGIARVTLLTTKSLPFGLSAVAIWPMSCFGNKQCCSVQMASAEAAKPSPNMGSISGATDANFSLSTQLVASARMLALMSAPMTVQS